MQCVERRDGSMDYFIRISDPWVSAASQTQCIQLYVVCDKAGEDGNGNSQRDKMTLIPIPISNSTHVVRVCGIGRRFPEDSAH